MIYIINYGLGNLGSISNMISKIGHKSKVITDPSELNDAGKIILPGVGSFDTGMKHLIDGGWIDILNRRVLDDEIPVLGICLGMQLMTNSSEEGKEAGLGWVDAQTIRFQSADNSLKIPHMGWNIVTPSTPTSLFETDKSELRFYHVHSYYVKLNDQSQEIASTSYGHPFTSAFQKKNVLGVQFHPEKSHKFGMSLLRNFCEKY